MKVVIVEALSIGLFALAAVHNDQGIAISVASNWAITNSVTERGKRSLIRSATGGSPTLLNCGPMSPVTKSPSHLTYRSGSGLSRWNSASAASICFRLSGLPRSSATGPRMLNNGSPSTFIAPKVSALTASNSNAAVPSRCNQ